jgi:hypothetical protein
LASVGHVPGAGKLHSTLALMIAPGARISALRRSDERGFDPVLALGSYGAEAAGGGAPRLRFGQISNWRDDTPFGQIFGWLDAFALCSFF